MVALDTLKVAKRVREAGFTEPQAEAVIAAVQEGTAAADLATKADIAALRSEISEVRAELRSAVAELRAEFHAAELRLEARIEAIKP
jgi:hypothetical protein